MKFPPRTPSVTRRAVRLYVRRRRIVTSLAVFLVGTGAAGTTLLVFFLLDRFWEWSTPVRAAGPWLVGACGVGASGVILYVLARRWSALATAIRLDLALPENLDRWGTSLDLAARLEQGEEVGAPECVERLFAETETATWPRSAPALVSLRSVALALAYAAAVAAAFVLLYASGSFDLPLLWRRFWHPRANLPRDSRIVARIVEANGMPLSPGAAELRAIPDGDTFSLKVVLYRKPDGFSLRGRREPVPLEPEAQNTIQPRLEVREAGASRTAELVRAGGAWTYLQRGLARPIRFRIRAGDGLTQWMEQAVQPRIRLSRVLHSVRYPGYSRLADVARQPLPDDRISLLEESRLFIEAECSEPYRSFEATFEVVPERGGTPTRSFADTWAGTGDDRGQAVELLRTEGKRDEPQKPQKRQLKVHRRSDRVAQLNLDIEQTGILRMHAVGANGLRSLERVCVVEAVKDMPPRVSISGIEPDTYIIPGELVAYEFKAEDDLGVADLIMDWDTAEGARSGDLYGEEYIHCPQLGQRVVAGREIIQRMNYHVYGTTPFRFRIVAIDSKGQEAVTERFRIHIVNNDYISRSEDAMAFFSELASTANRSTNYFRGLLNQLNIIEKAVGDRKTWPPEQDELLKQYEDSAYRSPGVTPMTRAMHRYSGFPIRMSRSLGFLLAADRLSLRGAEVAATAQEIRRTADLQVTLRTIRAVLSDQLAIAETWSRAVEGEYRRFIPESVLQQARRIRYGLTDLQRVRSQKDLYEKNLDFYLGKLDALMKQAETPDGGVPEAAQCLRALKEAAAKKDAEAVLGALEPLISQLLALQPPPSAELVALAAKIANAPDRERRWTAIAEVVAVRGGDAIPLPLEHMGLAEAWIRDTAKDASPFFPDRADPVEVWLAIDQFERELNAYRRNCDVGRYRLDPGTRRDAEAELREQAIVLNELLSRCPELARRTGAEAALAKIVAGDVRDVSLSPCCEALASIARPRLGAVRAQALQHLALLREGMNRLATQYDEFSVRAVKLSQARPPMRGTGPPPEWELVCSQGRDLEIQAAALEASYRLAFLAFLRTRLLDPQGPGGWDYWERFHAMQLAMTLLSLDSYERVPYRILTDYAGGRPLNWDATAVAGRNATNLAVTLRLYGEMVQALSEGKPLKYDFETLMKKSRTVGHLEALKAEFEAILPALRDRAQPEELAGLATQLRKSVLGRAALAEMLIVSLSGGLARLEQALDKPADATAALEQIRETLARRDEKQRLDSLENLLREVRRPAAPGREATLKQQFALLKKDLDEEIASICSMAQLPPINTQRRENTRGWRRNEFWGISTRIAFHDLRWQMKTREEELALSRELVGLAFPSDGSRPALTGARLQYASLVELRARQVADERRRNRGISFLGEESGPTLRLPKHIADELLRARNRKSPLYFKNWTETYYRELCRELAQ